MKVLSFGEILWDIIEGKPHLGGAPLNFAAHIAKCGAESSIMSRVGKDTLGQQALDLIAKAGVDTTFVEFDEEHATGTVDVYLVDGQPDYDIHTKVAYDYINYESNVLELGKCSYDVLYFGTVAQRQEESEDALSQLMANHDFQYRIYDVNLRKNCYNQRIVDKSLKAANIIKISLEELPEVSNMLFDGTSGIEENCAIINERYSPEVLVITAGGEGSYIYAQGQLAKVAAEKIQVVDAIGAGDSFSAAFMYMYFHTKDALQSARVASKVGAFVATQRGAIPDYSEELRSTLNSATP